MSILLSSDIEYWYKGLNTARTHSSIGLSSITESSYSGTQDRIDNLIQSLSSTRNDNKFLAMSDFDVQTVNLEVGDVILEEDKQDIDNSILSILRVCSNIDCQTICTNTGTNNNVANSDGTCSNVAQSNGINAHGTCVNGVNTNGYNGNGSLGYTCSYGAFWLGGGQSNRTCWNGNNVNGTINIGNNLDYACSNSTHVNGTNSNGTNAYGTNSNVAQTNGTNTNGTNENGTKSNGNSNSIYDPDTATYSAKNHYSEEEAKNRLGGG